MAHSFLAAAKHFEAQGLFGRAAERCRQAVSKYGDCSRPDEAAGAQLVALEQQAGAWATVAAAEVHAAQLREAEAAQEGLQGMSLAEQEAAAAAGEAGGKKRGREEDLGYMAENLDVWESFVGSGKGQARICRWVGALMGARVGCCRRCLQQLCMCRHALQPSCAEPDPGIRVPQAHQRA